jgi:N-acetylglucosaminyl-diphospho-decaprenol L-rhamnosyltransferase
MSPELSIIIVNWNTRELLVGCLQALEDPNVQPSERSDVETFVVDNASADGSADMVRERFPWVRLIENAHNVGFARANNQCIALSRGHYLLLLNSDTLLPCQSVWRLVQVADAQPDVGIVGCMLRNPDGSFQASYNDFPTLGGEWLSALGLARRLLRPQYPSHSESESQERKLADWIPGSVMLLRAAAIREVGGFDEGYVMYSEETDLCWRVWKTGWKVLYTPEVQVMHLGGGSANRTSPHQIRRLYRSKRLFFRKTRGPVAALVYDMGVRVAAAAKVGVWLAALAFVPSERRRPYLRKIQSHLLLAASSWEAGL